jgi:hypothetical protein
MAGRKIFAPATVLTAADVNSFLMDQSVMVFDNDTARGSAIPAPIEGMTTYLSDIKRLELYNGTSWVNAAGAVVSQTNGVVTTATEGSAVVRNITLSTAAPGTADGMNGDVWLQYEA